jgi:hypothetical protein
VLRRCVDVVIGCICSKGSRHMKESERRKVSEVMNAIRSSMTILLLIVVLGALDASADILVVAGSDDNKVYAYDESGNEEIAPGINGAVTESSPHYSTGVATEATEMCCTKKEERFDNWPQYPHSGDNTNVDVCAQSFMPQYDFELCKVSVLLDTSPGGTSATLYVQDGPTAGATVYTQKTITGMFGEKWFQFDVPDIQVDQDQEYYIRVTGEVLWRKYHKYPDKGDPYARGHAYLHGNKIDDEIPGKTDYWFITYTYEPCSSTDATVTSFAADGSGGFAELEWETAAETDNAGFRVYRGRSEDGPRFLLNETLIPARGDELRGASYSLCDYDVTDGVTYVYWLESVDLNDNGRIEGMTTVTVGERATPAATGFSLTQNCPNPFNPVTEIMYELPVDCHVRLEIYNVLGQRIVTLVDGYQAAGGSTVRWDGRDRSGAEVASGIYFYRIKAGTFEDVKRMVLLR